MSTAAPRRATGELPKVLRPFRLWLGMLVPPGAWMAQLFGLYMLEDFVSCTPGSQTKGVILGFGVRGLAIAITLVTAGATVAATALSWAAWKYTSAHPDPAIGGRGRWMALAGLMNGVLFLLIIVMKLAPPLMLEVCRRSV